MTNFTALLYYVFGYIIGLAAERGVSGVGFPNNGEQEGADYSRQEMADFIAKNQQYYMEKFSYLEQEEFSWNKFGYNAGAFFFGPFWLAYRKMYRNCLFFSVIYVIIYVSIPREFKYAFHLMMPIVNGYIGNFLYMLHVKEKLRAAPEFGDPAREDYIRKKGGVGWGVPLALLGICSFIVIFIARTIYMFFDFIRSFPD